MTEKELYYQPNCKTSTKEIWFKFHLWKFVDKYFFKTSPNCMTKWRVFLLRRFGARIGEKVFIANNITITKPWDFEMGDCSSLDELCYLIPPIKIGDYVSISNNVHLIAGGHDVRSRGFERIPKLITIEHGCFLGASSFVGGGVTIGQFSVLGAKAVTYKDIPANSIAIGFPAKVLSERIPRGEYENFRYSNN